MMRIICLIAAVAALCLAACGSSNDGGSTSGGSSSTRSDSSSSSTSARAIAVPAGLRQKGYVDVAVADNHPPYTYTDSSGEVVGLEIELLDAAVDKLGVEARHHALDLEAMIPSVASGRNDVMVGHIADTADRRKQVSFIDVYRSSLRVMTLKGNPHKLDPKSLCGHEIAVTTASLQETFVGEISDQCVKDGQPKIDVLAFPEESQEYLAVANGRAEGDIVNPEVGNYLVEERGMYEVLPQEVPTSGDLYFGWVFARDNKPVRTAFLQAINELIKDGTWKSIMGKYGLTGDALVVPPMVSGQPAADGS